MFNLSTKKSRLEYQQAQIDLEISKGATLEIYKGLKIVTSTKTHRERTVFFVLVFWDNSGHPTVNEYYQSEESRARRIETSKKNYDSRTERKAKAKAEGKQVSNQAQAAAAIREELKTKFQGIKFSVTSEGYSMGDSVNIRWEDGPTANEVSDITCKYQYGHFNGMEDIYEYSNTRTDIPQSKHVFDSRKKSDHTKEILTAAALQIWPGEDWRDEQSRDRSLSDIWHKTSLPAGAIVKGLKWEGNEIIIDFEAPTHPTTTKEEPTFEKQEVKAGQVHIIDYSEKAFAVIGDTRPIKDKLKSLGGKFNFRLSCGPGWIFPKSKIEAITKALNSPLIPNVDTIESEAVEQEAKEVFEDIRQKWEETKTDLTPEKIRASMVSECEAQGIVRMFEEVPETFNYAG